MTKDAWHDRSFAEGWDETGSLTTNPDRQRQLSLLADLLVSNKVTHLLDLGIGSAQVESAINRRHPDFFDSCRVTGIDASDAMLDLARRRCASDQLSGVELVSGDFASIGSIRLAELPDAVICVQALHEVTHAIKQSVFAWVHELLPAGRPFYILDRFDYAAGAWLDDWRATWSWMSLSVADDVLDFDEYHQRYQAKTDHTASVDDYRTWLTQAGFETLCPYQCFNRAMIAARAHPPQDGGASA